MNGEDGNVLLLGQAEQPRPEQRSRREIERRANLITRQPVGLGFALGFRQPGQVGNGERHAECGQNDLYGYAALRG